MTEVVSVTRVSDLPETAGISASDKFLGMRGGEYVLLPVGDVADNADAAEAAAAQTALDRVATAEDRTATNADALATAADRVQTGLDKSAADAARDAAILANASIGYFYDATLAAALSAGLSAASEGETFHATGDDVDYIGVYQDVSGAAVEVARFPAAQYLLGLSQSLERLKANLAQGGLLIYNGDGPVYPLVTSQEGNVVLGWDDTEKRIVGFGLHDKEAIQDFAAQIVAQRGLVAYTGSGPIWPIVTDKDGTVLLGYDETSGAIIGPGLSDPAITTGVATAQGEPTPLAASLVPVTSDKNHMLFYGQSLSVGAAAGAVLSVAQPYSNITFQGGPRAYDGSAYSWGPFKALVEDEVSPAPDGGTNRKETCCSGAANYATTLAALDGIDPASHVILASTAGHGGYRIDQLESGTAWWAVFQNHVSEAYALDTNYACHALCWLQGENDISVSNYATYRAKLEALQADAETYVKSVNGQTSPVFLLTYQLSWGIATSSHVADAQLNLAQNNDKVFLVTPTYHLPYAGDNVHLTAVGYKWIGAYFGRAYKALVHDNVQPRWLNPVSATRRGAVIRVRFDVPYRPLRLDTDTLAATTDFGFRVTDGGVTASISSVEVDGDDVVITLAAVPSGAVEVRYALDYLGSGLTLTGGRSGNLRDSAPETITISGTEYPLYNVAPHFRLTAVALGE